MSITKWLGKFRDRKFPVTLNGGRCMFSVNALTRTFPMSPKYWAHSISFSANRRQNIDRMLVMWRHISATMYVKRAKYSHLKMKHYDRQWFKYLILIKWNAVHSVRWNFRSLFHWHGPYFNADPKRLSVCRMFSWLEAFNHTKSLICGLINPIYSRVYVSSTRAGKTTLDYECEFRLKIFLFTDFNDSSTNTHINHHQNYSPTTIKLHIIIDRWIFCVCIGPRLYNH